MYFHDKPKSHKPSVFWSCFSCPGLLHKINSLSLRKLLGWLFNWNVYFPITIKLCGTRLKAIRKWFKIKKKILTELWNGHFVFLLFLYLEILVKSVRTEVQRHESRKNNEHPFILKPEPPGFRLLPPYGCREKQQKQVTWQHTARLQRLYSSPVPCTVHHLKYHKILGIVTFHTHFMLS